MAKKQQFGMKKTTARIIILRHMAEKRYSSVEDAARALYGNASIQSYWNTYGILSRMQDYGAVKYIKSQELWKITVEGRKILNDI